MAVFMGLLSERRTDRDHAPTQRPIQCLKQMLVIPSAAKQSILSFRREMDCFASLAMTLRDVQMRLRDPAARSARVLQRLSLTRGSRGCRVRAAPAVSRAKLCVKAHTSIQVQRKH